MIIQNSLNKLIFAVIIPLILLFSGLKTQKMNSSTLPIIFPIAFANPVDNINSASNAEAVDENLPKNNLESAEVGDSVEERDSDNEEVLIDIKNPIGSPDTTTFLEKVFLKLKQLVGYAAVLSLVVSGFLYVLSGAAGGNEQLATYAKKVFTFSLVGLALILATPTFLKEMKIIIFGDVETTVAAGLEKAPSLVDIISRTLKFLLSIVGILAIISLVISGFMYVFAATSEEMAKNALKSIQYSLLGIIVVGLALIIVEQISKFF